MTYQTCSRCGREFISNKTPEALLLDAIFGKNLCYNCIAETYPRCSICGDLVSNPIIYNGKSYCSECIDEVLP